MPSGQVISQNPSAGSSVSTGASVALLISSGPATLAVPDVVGLTQAAAQTAITNAGLSVGAITSAASDTVPSGQVISQNPSAGSSVSTGASVALLISSGPATDGAYLNFDGINDRVVVPDATSLRLTNAITVEAWIRPRTLANNNNFDRVVRKGASYELTTSTGDSTCLAGTSGHVQWRLTISGVNRHICGGTLTPGTWYHVAGTYDGATIALYLNGTLAAKAVRTGTVTVDNKILTIGNNENGNRAFDGVIDAVAVWSRALSSSEVFARVTHALTGAETNLVSYWSFNEPSGQTAFDATGNANHGRLGTKSIADSADPSRQVSSTN